MTGYRLKYTWPDGVEDYSDYKYFQEVRDLYYAYKKLDYVMLRFMFCQISMVIGKY